MSTTERRVEMNLEVQIIPVSDVDRAKGFYEQLGWRLDDDAAPFDALRIVQFTPPGSGASVTFGKGLTTAAPSSAKGAFIVSDIEAARDGLARRGIKVSDVWHGPPFPVEARQPCANPEQASLVAAMASNAVGRVGRTLSLALALGLALALYGAPASAEQLPPAPSPVPVTLDPSTAALVVLDITTQTCSPQASCTAMLPRVASLLASARNAGVFVVYSTPATVPPILPEVAPVEGDPSVAGLGQDRFFDTPLDELLRAKGITHLILVGWRADGSVLYTSVGATLRTYTVVVPMDGTAASQDYDLAVGWYQMLTQLSANATNEPLKKSAVTLSRIDMITFQASG